MKKHDEEAQLAKSNLHKKIVRGLYKTLAAGDPSTVSKLLSASTNVEWRFHGPPQCQYMMSMLMRGSTAANNFSFKPRRIMAFRDRVIVEGWVGKEAYWVHVWTLDAPPSPNSGNTSIPSSLCFSKSVVPPPSKKSLYGRANLSCKETAPLGYSIFYSPFVPP